MTDQEALTIIETLASGIDPRTGATFPPDSVYENGSVVRALFVAVNALKRRVATARRRASQPDNTGRLWNQQQDHALVMEFERGSSIATIAQVQARSVGAIVARLVKLGLLDVESMRAGHMGTDQQSEAA